ncbi:thioredoxin domain-containing protein [Winogradskyella sediminis]|uniref:Uncharacterized protein n=1 Tax=Winogradskyella sediminis TaxID=1382466 RepID=A0A1H1RGF1_9FLAO|nr:hypothetical protein [Winogradskyella sediminis]SDS34765.1 hypothetical protein SAMN04489797_1406 [Winogradskyella sediminis]
MQLTEKHITFIENSLSLYGVENIDLRDDLLDHICTYIENQDSEDFNELYQQALQKFGGYASFKNLQLETNHQKFAKEIITINKVKFAAGFLIILLLVVSLVFQMMQWPYANAYLLAAIAVSVLVILPAHFYAAYKKSIHKYS